MCSRCSALRCFLTVFAAGVLVAVLAPGARAQRINQTPLVPVPSVDLKSPVLRVCADPNNLPFSNGRREGFENEVARLVAADLGKRVTYAWWPQRRGFVRQTLAANRCDVIMGVPNGYDLTLTTRPYYRSTYVFVSRRDRHLRLRSFNDSRLHTLRIGVHAIGADYAALPPVMALSHRGIVSNIHGYSIYGDYSRPNPPAELVEAVTSRRVDVAVGWGPLVGYFARRSPVPLDVVAVSPQVDLPYTPLVFDIAMGVRRTDSALRDLLNGVIERRHEQIDRILRKYDVPLLDLGGWAAPSVPVSRGR